MLCGNTLHIADGRVIGPGPRRGEGKMQPTSDEPRPLPSAPEEPLPERIGRNRILARLGAGGMGTVYKAHDPDLDRPVALKLPHFAGSPRDREVRVQRFQREARAAARVWHPHVCPIYDVGEHEGQPYVIMAYVEGQSLAQRLAREGRCEDVGEAVAAIRQVLDALEAVHAHGIIHRDLKPSNILIDRAGRAILTDFGLARPENDAEHLTSEGFVVGTPAYMAPEQAAGQSERVGPWTDIYSLGVVLYQMLTGRLPFEGPGLTVLSRIIHEAPPPPSRLRKDLDPALEAVLMKALAKEPDGRYRTAREMREALDRWLRGRAATGTLLATSAAPPPSALPSGKPPPGPENGLTTTPIHHPESQRARRWPLRLAAAGCVATAFVLAGACLIPLALFWQRPPATTRPLGGAVSTFPVGVGHVSGALAGPTALAHKSARDPALLRAAEKDQAVNTYQLLKEGADLNARDPRTGETPLMKAASRGYVKVVNALYSWEEQGFGPQSLNVNAKDNGGETALMKAAENGHTAVVERMLKPAHRFWGTLPVPMPAEVNEEDNQGKTALTKAKEKGHTKIVDLLKKAGARE
jgi:hypothetical protein